MINGIVYNKWDDFKFEIVKFQFLYEDVPRSRSYCVYISHLSYVSDFYDSMQFLTAKLIKEGY